jgi:hypothetical protein
MIQSKVCPTTEAHVIAGGGVGSSKATPCFLHLGGDGGVSGHV